MEPGDLVFDITAGIERKHLYTATVRLVGIEDVVQVLMLNFSELCLYLFTALGFNYSVGNICCLRLLKL